MTRQDNKSLLLPNNVGPAAYRKSERFLNLIGRSNVGETFRETIMLLKDSLTSSVIPNLNHIKQLDLRWVQGLCAASLGVRRRSSIAKIMIQAAMDLNLWSTDVLRHIVSKYSILRCFNGCRMSSAGINHEPCGGS